MWGENSNDCENNCQCSGLITENFRINSGNNATKRKQEEALSYNYKVKIKPHSIDFTPHSPNTPSKVLGEIQKALTPQRKVLGEIQNSPSYKLDYSPLTFKSQNSPNLHGISNIPNSPVIPKTYSPRIPTSSGISNIHSSPGISRVSNSPGLSRINQSPGMSRIKNSPTTPLTTQKYSPRVTQLYIKNSPAMERLKSPSGGLRERKRSRLSRVFEDRTMFKANKENENLNIEEETQDCTFGMEKSHLAKLDFSDIKKEKEMNADILVPETATSLEPDMESLQDLEEEFDSNNFDECTKYEIISTDSPDIISSGRTSSRKVNQRNFAFGAPLSENETSTSFNRPSSSRVLNFEKRIERSKSNRTLNFDESRSSFDKMEFDPEQIFDFNSKTKTKLNFDDSNFEESFEFTSPMTKETTPRKTVSVKKSLKFTESPKFERHSSISKSPCSSMSKRLTSESMESGFISEFEEPFLDMEEISSSPKISNFSDLLSGQIKESFTEKLRPCVHRSLSFNPVSKRLRDEPTSSSKRLKSETTPAPQRPVLQRALSENNASIMSALARSCVEPDLIGDFSSPFALPLTAGDHSDLKSISGDTLASLIRGEYSDSIDDFQVIDCRYPYEFEGGHILGAVNMSTAEQVLELMNAPPSRDTQKRRILVFHCEFSLERGPKLSRFLRSSDRAKNQENYPNLHYPEIYLLHAGYRSFFKNYPELCSPNGYTAMLDPKHRHLLRKHRSLQPSGRRNRLLL
ncbi:M-phase inducer phosphatase [Pieris rapae]|uniref:M-phase inducer phosphatase n=1 Tax=Pieris rapae TaxID=64459 RepID=UPI001E281A8A|nr:M-phase inducer phosphatase [Pieris rapae]